MLHLRALGLCSPGFQLLDQRRSVGRMPVLQQHGLQLEAVDDGIVAAIVVHRHVDALGLAAQCAGRACDLFELLEREGIPLRGQHAVVIGRSDIVGKPMALLLLHRDATVTICHSRTANLPGIAATADVLVAAVGRPGFVTADFVKPGATVIDVGINLLTDAREVERLFPEGSPKRQAFERKGSVLIGDVHPSVAAVAGGLTPVPGGIGPLTIAMVLRNTIAAAEARS